MASSRADGLPAILLAIAIMAALGAKTSNVIIALIVVFTPHVAGGVRQRAGGQKPDLRRGVERAPARGRPGFCGQCGAQLMSRWSVQATFHLRRLADRPKRR